MQYQWMQVVEIIAYISIALTTIIYLFQFIIMRKSCYAQNTITAMNLLSTPDVQQARKVVITKLKNKSSRKWSREQIKCAELVYTSYDEVGILVKNKYVGQKLILKIWGRSIVQCSDILIEYLRDLHLKMPDAMHGAHLLWLRNEIAKKKLFQILNSSLCKII